MARRCATRIGVIRANRFAQIASNLRSAIFWWLETQFAKKRVQFGNLQAIHTNLRFGSRKSGHLSNKLLRTFLLCLHRKGVTIHALLRFSTLTHNRDHTPLRCQILYTPTPTSLKVPFWGWVHQNRASPFASAFRRRLRYRREFRNGNQICPFQSQRTWEFASDLRRRGNRTSWGLKNRAILRGSGKNRRRNRRESRDFGALSSGGIEKRGAYEISAVGTLKISVRVG